MEQMPLFLKWYTKTKPLSLYLINVTQKDIKANHTIKNLLNQVS